LSLLAIRVSESPDLAVDLGELSTGDHREEFKAATRALTAFYYSPSIIEAIITKEEVFLPPAIC
jgi:hypothetical protein